MTTRMLQMVRRCIRAARDERGSVILMVTFSIVAIFAFAVLAVDGAVLMTARTQLHAAADAAALAGASGLIDGDEDLAVERAVAYAGFNKAVEDGMQPVTITPDDVTFPEPDVVRVRTHRTRATDDPIHTFFLRVIDPTSDNRAEMTAVSAARAYDVCSSKCLKPWAIPDRWNDANGNGAYDEGETYDPDGTGYTAPGDVGTTITLKVGNPQDAISPGVFYPVDYPPLDNATGMSPLTGGAWYESWISGCEPYVIGPGDRLQLEPGNMVGPTAHGMEDLVAQDPGATWDPETKTIVGSAYGLSPRIGLVPFFDPTLPPGSGRNWVRVTKVGAFFIESVGPGSQVVGRFIEITAQGNPCPGGGIGPSLVKGIVLVQ